MLGSRRRFLKTVSTVLGMVPLVGRFSIKLWAAAPPQDRVAVNRLEVMKAFGDTMIPSAPDDPGYKDLEAYGISEEVLKALGSTPEATFALFETTPKKSFGEVFTALDEKAKAAYLRKVLSGEGLDPDVAAKLREFYRLGRMRVMTVYYQNFPEHKVKRDSQGLPVLPANDLHQISTPNTKEIVTGWDVAGWKGPLTWEEEEELRTRVQKLHWHPGIQWP